MSVTTCTDNNDCDLEYPNCLWNGIVGENRCYKTNFMYSRWSPGVVQGELGWAEFMPAGALLGIPWVQTAYNNIFSESDIVLSPPPRGSGEHTATYLILADGSIEGITNINRRTSD